MNLKLPPSVSACVIGCGKAGSRFIRAVNYLGISGIPIHLKFVCDQNPESFSSLELGAAVEKFTDYFDAFSKHPDIDLIFVCVNDDVHFEIFSYIKKSSIKYKRILSEKPLTKNFSEALEVAALYRNEDITLNFVERYSPIVNDFVTWRNQNNLIPIKAQFFWGKYRIHDPRRTIGVLSEIAHPLDLSLYLMGIEPEENFILRQVIGERSDYSEHAENLLDTVSVALTVSGGLTITGHSSFVWETRRRSITIFLRDASLACGYMAVFNFDNPVWDCDNLKIFDILSYPGRIELIKEFDYREKDSIKEIFKVNKIYNFIVENINDIYGEKGKRNLAYLDQAIYVQSILENIEVQTLAEPSQIIYQKELGILANDIKRVNEEQDSEHDL